MASRFHLGLQDMGIELTVVPGNHDRGLEAACLPVRERVTIGGWRIVHGSAPLPRGRVIFGHYHPALRIDRRPVPCFLIGRRHMILPAFSLDASGGLVLSGRSRGTTATVEREAIRSGEPGIPAWPPNERQAAAWQAVAIVGNSLVAVCQSVKTSAAAQY